VSLVSLVCTLVLLRRPHEAEPAPTPAQAGPSQPALLAEAVR